MIILAMAFLIVILTLVLAIMTLAYTGSASLHVYRLERNQRYNADAAMQAAVQRVKVTPTLGETASTSSCAYNYPVQEAASVAIRRRAFTAGSTLSVSCAATTGVTSGGLDVDLGQAARDVTFEVTCAYSTIPEDAPLACGSGSKTLVLGRARVRFDPDYGYPARRKECPEDRKTTPAPAYGGTGCPPIPEGMTAVPTVCSDANKDGDSLDPEDCGASTRRANVAKVVYWSLRK